ncbi:MAG: precorrin-8X methylmutase, partial [Deltaproteobacteria bacterium]|nr:precorrin-8X methylmutase [Deltaproteobacteria bacterium]
MKPKEIESLSFKIIDREAGDHGFSDSQWPIVKRMIHASADFEYMETVRFHPRAVESGINAIRQGKPILT